MQKKALLSTFAAAASVSMLVACGPAPTQTPDPSASPSASAVPSATPTEEPSTTPSASAEPSATPTASPSAEPTAQPSANPSASATPTPLPSATSDISVIETTTFNGKVYDDTNAPLDGVSITAKSLNSSVPFEATTTTAGGTYSFNNAPSGVQIEITASRSGFTTRRRVEVLKSNKQGDPNANKYDFGTDGSAGSGSKANALSDKPEVTMVTPGRNASGIDPKTSFVLKFSEPMDRNSVEDAFSVHVFEDQQFSIDNKTSSALKGTFDALGTGGFSDVNSFSASLIWDESDFNATWNSDDTEVTFTFADEKLLPTDKDSDKVPDYMVTFAQGNSAKTIKDKSGILRRDEWFKLTDGDFENYFKFAIRTDEVKPSVSSVIATSQEGGSLRGDAIKVRFSERMLVDTKAGDIGASNTNLNSDANMNPLNANLYTVSVTTGPSSTMNYNWGTTNIGVTSVGGSVVFDADDLTRKTVILLAYNDLNTSGNGNIDASTASNIFKRSDVVKVTVSSSVVDPAGNTMESRNADKTTTAG